ncbi:MAG TPA: peptidylprolyl isomerase [Microbacteriaceae bacterium]|nr:peptidylprolyl isomerase [Microbacteriaceae bacterium]
MAPNKPNDREARQARERLRAYQARQTVHGTKLKRRKRDNWIAGVGVVIIIALAVGTQLLYFGTGPGKAVASASPSATPTPTSSPASGAIPSKTIAQNRTWTGTLTLNNVALGIQLDGAKAPQAVSSTIDLINKGFYTGLTCHRLVNGGFYVLQCGDPKGDGTGGPGYNYGPIENAPSNNVYPAGTIAMARSSNNANSQGSQFFIVYKETNIPSDSAGGYTVIGQVTSGLPELYSQITDAGVQGGAMDGKPVVPTTITGITVQ